MNAAEELAAVEEQAVEALISGGSFDEKAVAKARQGAQLAAERIRLEAKAKAISEQREADAVKKARIAELTKEHRAIQAQDTKRQARLMDALAVLSVAISEEFLVDERAQQVAAELVQDLGIDRTSLPGTFRARAFMQGEAWQWKPLILKRCNATNEISIVLPIHGSLY